MSSGHRHRTATCPAARRLPAVLALAAVARWRPASAGAADQDGLHERDRLTAGQRDFDLTGTGDLDARRQQHLHVGLRHRPAATLPDARARCCASTRASTVTVTLHNNLPGADSLVFPGQTGVTATGGARDGLFTREAAAGGDRHLHLHGRPSPAPTSTRAGPTRTSRCTWASTARWSCGPAGLPRLRLQRRATRFDPDARVPGADARHRPRPAPGGRARPGLRRHQQHDRYWTINGRSFPDTIADNNATWLPQQPYGALVARPAVRRGDNRLPALIRYVNAGFEPPVPPARQPHAADRPGRAPAARAAARHLDRRTSPDGRRRADLGPALQLDERGLLDPATNPVPVAAARTTATSPSRTATPTTAAAPTSAQGHPAGGGGVLQQVRRVLLPAAQPRAERVQNFDEGFGGLATLLRVDPPGGCSAAPTATKNSSDRRDRGPSRTWPPRPPPPTR